MPLSNKLNFEVGCRTWRFDPEVHPLSGAQKRGGRFEPPSRGSQHPQAPSVKNLPIQPESEKIPEPPPTEKASSPVPDPELLKIELEKRLIAEEKARLEAVNREAAEKLHQLEEMSQKAAYEREVIAQLAQRAAEDDERQRQHYLELEANKQRLLDDAEARLQKLRKEVAAVEEKHRVELAHWEERERRTIQLEREAEARAKAREAAEEARAAERQREAEAERAAALERLKQEVIEEYKRTHDELRKTQEKQLKEELEEARRKIDEEDAARKDALEKEREATMAKVKEEAEILRKHMEEQIKLDRERSEALKEANAKAAEEFKKQQQEAIKNLYSAAGGRCLPHGRTTKEESSRPSVPLAGPIPPDASPRTKQRMLHERRQALRDGVFMGLKTHHPAVDGRHDYWVRSAPQPLRVFGISPSSNWGSPVQRPRANSVGQTNMGTPFVLGSSQPTQLANSHLAPPRVSSALPGAYPRPTNSNGKAGLTYGSTSLMPSNASSGNWPLSSSRGSKSGSQFYGQTAAPSKIKGGYASQSSKPFKGFQCPPLKEEVESDDPSFCVVTLTSIPGFEIFRIYGEVFGVALRNIPDYPPPKDMTMEEQEMMLESAISDRRRAVTAMIKNAKAMGANCVIGLAFETHPISPGSAEIWAIGTAVNLVAYDQTAVLPNTIEHATRTALENQRQGIVSGTSGNNSSKSGSGGGVEGEKKKGKKKNKADASNEGENGWGAGDHDNQNSNKSGQKKKPGWNSNDANGARSSGCDRMSQSCSNDSNNTSGGWGDNTQDTNGGANGTTDNWGKSSNGKGDGWGERSDDKNDGGVESFNDKGDGWGESSNVQNDGGGERSNDQNDGWGEKSQNSSNTSGGWPQGFNSSGFNQNCNGNGSSNRDQSWQIPNGRNDNTNGKGKNAGAQKTAKNGKNAGGGGGKKVSNNDRNIDNSGNFGSDGWQQEPENFRSNESKNKKPSGNQNNSSSGPNRGQFAYSNFNNSDPRMVRKSDLAHMPYSQGMSAMPDWVTAPDMMYRQQFGGLYGPMYQMPGGWPAQIHGAPYPSPPIYFPHHPSHLQSSRPERMLVRNVQGNGMNNSNSFHNHDEEEDDDEDEAQDNDQQSYNGGNYYSNKNNFDKGKSNSGNHAAHRQDVRPPAPSSSRNDGGYGNGSNGYGKAENHGGGSDSWNNSNRASSENESNQNSESENGYDGW